MENSTKKNIAWSLRIIISALFIVSALAKLSKGSILDSPYFAISTFEVKQLYTLGFSESLAPYFSRILIGIEIALGLLILQGHYLRKIIIPSTILLLSVFVCHLTYVTFLSGGNTGNCGCFGELIPMTPIEAIIKNIIAIGLLFYLLKVLPNKSEQHCNFWVVTTITLGSILFLFMLAPIQPKATFTTSETTENTIEENTITSTTPTLSTVNTDTVKKGISSKEIEPKKVGSSESELAKQTLAIDEPARHKSGNTVYFSNIDKGRKTLCFFVPGCDHCREAAKELTELKKADKNFPDISIVFMNEEAFLIPEFFKFAGAEYPYKIIEIIPFWKALGNNRDTPGVKYLWNGNEIKYYDGIKENKFNAAEYKELINKKYSELKK